MCVCAQIRYGTWIELASTSFIFATDTDDEDDEDDTDDADDNDDADDDDDDEEEAKRGEADNKKRRIIYSVYVRRVYRGSGVDDIPPV